VTPENPSLETVTFGRRTVRTVLLLVWACMKNYFV